jgi:hypothetical protein
VDNYQAAKTCYHIVFAGKNNQLIPSTLRCGRVSPTQGDSAGNCTERFNKTFILKNGRVRVARLCRNVKQTDVYSIVFWAVFIGMAMGGFTMVAVATFFVK